MLTKAFKLSEYIRASWALRWNWYSFALVDVPHLDDRPFLEGSREERDSAVKRECRDGNFVCPDYLRDGERLGQKQQDVA